MTKKESAYQKIKRENKLLKKKIDTLVNNPDSKEATIIKVEYKFLRDLEDAIMTGIPSQLISNQPK